MAEPRRIADLNYGHPGSLTYISGDGSGNEPGVLHTSRVLKNAPNFKIVGSAAELYPPSKSAIPEVSTPLWQERQVQKRWLFKFHPEAYMGSVPIVHTFLKEEMRQFAKSEDKDTQGALLAMGEMTDLRDIGHTKGIPVLVAATGESGESLRFSRMEQSQWQWDDDASATLSLSSIDSFGQEQVAVWPGNSLQILKIEFATAYWQYGSVRWLLVQDKASVTIFQPEYHALPLPGGGKSGSSSQPPSFITPNPLITLQHKQTGGNAISDVCFNPPSPGSPPQITVIDECGYWSVWSVLGSRQMVKDSLRLALYKCGHISEGFTSALPARSMYEAENHGVLQVGRTHQNEPTHGTFQRAAGIKLALNPSQHILMWNSESISLLDLETDNVLPKIDILAPSRRQEDWILDIQRSPSNENHVFVLTARQIIWLDLFPPSVEPGTNAEPRILLTVSHIGCGNEHCKMSLCQVSESVSNGSMVFVHLPSVDQLTVYWFVFSSDTNLPQWHRHITTMPRETKDPLPSAVQSIMVQPAKLEIVPVAGDVPVPGTEYVQSDTRFYQVTILGEDLGVRYCICSTSINPSLEVTLPTSRIGWAHSKERRRWKRMRRHFLRHMADTFVLPDGVTDAEWYSVLTKEDPKRNDGRTPDAVVAREVQPVWLRFGKMAETITSQLQASISAGERGLPTQLVTAARGVLERGVEDGHLPLTSWMEIMSDLEQPIALTAPGEGMEAEIEGLLRNTDDDVVVTQLRRLFAKEAPDSLLGYPFLKEDFSEFWLDPVEDVLTPEMKQVRKIWVAEVARDVFLSSYGFMVQNVPLLGPRISEPVNRSQVETPPPQRIQSSYSSQGIPSSPPAGPTSENEPPDAAFQRLKLLAPTIEEGTLGSLKQPKVLSYWPAERGVDVEDYVSSVAEATEAKLSYAKRRLQKIKAKRKAQVDKYKRPSFMRQGFPASDGAGEGMSTLVMRPPPVQVMSSQQRMPDSSQSVGFSGPSVTMSQPVSGAFGDRKTAKKGKRKSGFR